MKTRRFIISVIALICTMGGAWASSIPGTLPGLFTINVSGEKVVFSQGNLQYQASTNTWRFAEHQYDYIGNVDGNTSPSSSQTEWIDYFNWGTSGYNHGANCYQPWSTSTSRSDYYAYGSNSKNLYDAKDDGTMRGQADWGYNAISNGGNAENIGWRTLTKEEWAYIINSRSGDYRYAKGTVHNKNGFIIFPDGFTLPEGISITNANTSDAGYTLYSDDDWAALETNGCVFLPATGMRNRTSVYETGSVGNYWSSSYMNNDRVYNIRFDESSLKIENDGDRQNGFPVRLVKASLDQDNGGYYLIGCVQDWKDFATLVETTPMANAKMTADIDLSTDVTMVGTESIPYQGTFDGQGHKLTVNWSVNGGGDGVAPFRYVSGATIQKLHVDGIISATGSEQRGAASIIALSKGSTTTTINECWGSVSLTCYDTIGGLFSVAYETSTVNITDCLFSGTINPTHDGKGFCAGFASHAMKEDSNGPTINITRGLYLGKYTGSTENCYNFVRMDFPDLFGTHTIKDCYYKDAYGKAQGTQVSSEELADGTTTAALNSNRTGDDAPWIQDPVTHQPMLKMFASLKQDAEGYYLIGSVKDWDNFAALVQKTPATYNAKLTADVDLGTDQTMLGSIEQPYSGTFDGQGFSLTVQLNSTLDGVAPFRRIDNTTIKNLAVAGTITGGIHCSGLVGGVPENSEDNLISNVMVSATITTTGSHCGGILGHGGSTLNTTIQDCLFNGTINGRDGGSTVGVIWGWQTYGNANITSCLENGTYTNCSSFDPVFMAYSAGAVINSTYYVTGNSTNGTQATTTTLSDGTVTSGLNADRTGDNAPWIQDPVTNLPILKVFVPNNSGISTGFIPIENGKLEMENEANGWYSISGQKLKGKPAAKGIYIRKGKKVIIN